MQCLNRLFYFPPELQTYLSLSQVFNDFFLSLVDRIRYKFKVYMIGCKDSLQKALKNHCKIDINLEGYLFSFPKQHASIAIKQAVSYQFIYSCPNLHLRP
jgi:CRISPR/Cas system type I-B associated protein Csh2 (Cas7 group RAMP superfamily)